MSITKDFKSGGSIGIDDYGHLSISPDRGEYSVNLYHAEDIEKLIKVAQAALAMHRAQEA